jgi:hypothetical protein
MERPRPLPALILALAACGTPARPGPPPAAAVTVSTELDLLAARPREGDLGAVIFRIRNASRNVVVLRDLTLLADPRLNELASAAASWQFTSSQPWSYDRARDEWVPDPKVGKPLGVFNAGLLCPGESIEIRFRFRLLGMPKRFNLLYFELPHDELIRKVYWEVRKDRDVRFRTLVGEELAARLRPSSETGKKGHRVVVFPHPDATGAQIAAAVVDAPLAQRPFGLEQAIARSGGTRPDQITYSTALEGWVLGRGDSYVLAGPSGTTPLPVLRAMEQVILHIDDTSPSKLQIELRGDSIATTMQREKRHALVSQQRDGRTRYYVFVEIQDLPKLFADVLDLKLAIGVDPTPEGGGRLQVIHRD